MEKDSFSGHPYHISPFDRRSGSRPENTVIQASETVATFNVSTSSGTIVSDLPPKRSETTYIYPVCENTPILNKNSTSPATRATIVVTATRRKHPRRNTRSFISHGTTAKNR